MRDSTAKYFIIISVILIALYFIWDSYNSKKQLLLPQNNTEPAKENIQKLQIDKYIKTNNDNNNLLTNSATINMDDVKNILYSEDTNGDILNGILQQTEDNTYSETTSKLINSSYNDMLMDVYKNLMIDISFVHMGTNKTVKFVLNMLKESELTTNFIGLIRNYMGSSVFAYSLTNKIMFLGDCYNNNGTANYNANHALTKVKYNKVSYIPAYTICMIGEIQNGEVYVGSQFIMTFQNINNNTKFIVNEKDKKNEYFQKVTNKHTNTNILLDMICLIPMCTFSIENNDEKLIETFYNNSVNTTKPRIIMINEERKDIYNNDNFNIGL